ncbi:MAG: hypothetical protein ACREVX_03460 [Clostridium sp.]|uniref:hypothetical protein n=1 Tax=Clostridium sp. TaxID=1506 RepID=UPI003D6CE7E9
MTGLLIFVGLILVILNILGIKKQNKSFNGVLGNAMENVQDYDIELGELRREFSESILELQSEIMGLKEIIEKNNIIAKDYDDLIYKGITKTDIELHDQKVNNEEVNQGIYEEGKNYDGQNEIIINKSQNSNSVKVDEIKRLFSDGQTVDKISEILHLGKGEVLLIKDLYVR